jgi:ectoine hydroxylase-related dioxygenase (phytanoyl-CoA dioxygenase family)
MPMTELALTVSDSERAAGRLRPEQHRRAALLLHTAGCVVLRDLLPLDQVDKINAAFGRILEDCFNSKRGDAWYQVSEREHAVFWERAARWRIFPKLRPPFDDERLLANPLIMSVLEEMLGNDLNCKFVSSDTCLPGSNLQPPHRELSAGGATTPCAYFVNVPLTLCGLENGPIEVWPTGTHLWQADVFDRYRLADDIQDDENQGMEEFASFFPSRKLVLEPGSILIRNPGMLHRGTPNLSEIPRTMLTICYLRRGHSHEYGDTRFNFDEALYERLSPAVKRVFAGTTVEQASPEPHTPSLPSRRWPWHRLR